MGRQVIITESDRQSILSMHRLILESEVTVTIEGVVMDGKGKTMEAVKVLLIDSNNEIKKGTFTDDKGYYKIDNVKVEQGDYNIKFIDVLGENTEKITIANEDTITLNKKMDFKVQDIETVLISGGKRQFIPILSVTVLDSNNDKIDGSEIEIYHNNTLIEYSTFITNDATTSIDSKNKKTTNGELKNIWINPDTYPIFSGGAMNNFCSKKETIKIVAKSKKNQTESNVEICLGNGFYILEEGGEIKLYLKETNIQNFNLVIRVTNTIQFNVIDSKTNEKVGPGIIDVYNDIAKTQYIGEVEINESGVGTKYIGTNDFGVLKITNDKTKIKPIKSGEYKIYLHSFEFEYEEFFKEYTINIKNDEQPILIKVPIEYNEGEDDDDKNENWFDKKSTRRVIYGKSDKKFNTPNEAEEDAKKDALEQYLNRSKKYKDSKELRGKTPSGGKLVYLHNYDDGTYSAVVRYKRRELKNFAKNYVPETPKEKIEKYDIKFSNVKLKDVIDGYKSVFVFALSSTGTSSKELYEQITLDKKLTEIINDNYTNIKVINDSNDSNYNDLITNYDLEFFPTVILFIDKKPYYFNNFKGSIYTQLKDYFKV
jgi:hypothetical protein